MRLEDVIKQGDFFIKESLACGERNEALCLFEVAHALRKLEICIEAKEKFSKKEHCYEPDCILSNGHRCAHTSTIPDLDKKFP